MGIIIVVPVIANAEYWLRFFPMPHVDLTPATFVVSTLAMTVALFNRQLLDIVPVARQSMMELMSEGFIVTNVNGYITDFNEAMTKLIDSQAKIEIGKKLPDTIKNQLKTDFEKSANQSVEIQLQNNDEALFFNVQISPLNLNNKEPSGFLLMFHDITKRKQVEAVIKQMAYHDQLTSLPNRTLFYDRAKMAIESAIRYKRNLAVLLLDVDQFKSINDKLGHEIGDLILKEIASRLSWATRKADTVSRFGGDEFIILLLEISDIQTVVSIASRIVKAINQPIEYSDSKLQITVSVGISIYPVDSGDLNTIINYADMAMYQAKQKGGNSFIRYNS